MFPVWYLEHQRVADALEVGRRTAEVYAAIGLVTYASVLEMPGRVREAADEWHQVAERYENFDATRRRSSCVTRSSTRNTSATECSPRSFPPDCRRIDGRNQAAPTRGLRIATTGFAGARDGLRTDDIITAVDGIAVWQHAAVQRAEVPHVVARHAIHHLARRTRRCTPAASVGREQAGALSRGWAMIGARSFHAFPADRAEPMVKSAV